MLARSSAALQRPPIPAMHRYNAGRCRRGRPIGNHGIQRRSPFLARDLVMGRERPERYDDVEMIYAAQCARRRPYRSGWASGARRARQAHVTLTLSETEADGVLPCRHHPRGDSPPAGEVSSPPVPRLHATPGSLVVWGWGGPRSSPVLALARLIMIEQVRRPPVWPMWRRCYRKEAMERHLTELVRCDTRRECSK
jgi:hypothetical protein